MNRYRTSPFYPACPAFAAYSILLLTALLPPCTAFQKGLHKVHFVHSENVAAVAKEFGPEDTDNASSRFEPLAVVKNPSEVVGVTLNSQADERALLLSTGVAALGSLLMMICFCVLRRLNPEIYTRSQAEQRSIKDLIEDEADEGDPESEQIASEYVDVGFFDWIWKVLSTTPEEEVACAGLDGWALLEFYRLNTRILTYMGVPILLAVGALQYYSSKNTLGLNSHQHTFGIDLLSRFDIASVTQENRNLFWMHAGAVWFVILISGWFIIAAHEEFTERRFEWLKAIPLPRATTVMVKNIPLMYRSDQTLRDYFAMVFSQEAVERAYVVRKTGTLPKKVEQLEASRYQLAVAKKEWERAGCPGPDEPAGSYLATCEQICEQRVELVSRAQAKIEEAVTRLDPAVCSSSGFVTFNSELAQRLASKEQYRRDVTEFVLAMPPDPNDVTYEHLAEDELGSAAWEWIAQLLLICLFIVWAPIVVLISGVTSLSSIERMLPSARIFLDNHPTIEPVVTGLVSTFALKLFMALLPSVLLGIIEKFTTLKAGADSQLRLQGWYTTFLILFVLLVTALGRGITSTVASVAASPSNIVNMLAQSLPNASHFYFSYTVVCCFTMAAELLRITNLIKYWFYRHFMKFQPEAAKRYSEPEDQASYGMGARSALAVLMSAIALVFCTCSPLIIVFSLPYFMLGQLVYGYLIVFCESKKPDLGGEFWMQWLQQLFSVLALYVIFMVGVILAKWDGTWLGPPAFSALSVLPLYYSWRRVNNLAFESLPLEEVVKASRAKQAVGQRMQGKYIQPECDPDLTIDTTRYDVS